MKQNCWEIREKNGFLMSPDPLAELSEVEIPLLSETTEHLQELADTLPILISTRQVRPVLAALPIYEMALLNEVADFRVHERLFQIYAHFANAYVWSDQSDPSAHIPAGVAVPLVALAKMVERPPIVPYASTALCNFQRIDPHGELRADNIRCVQKLVDIPDESWFHLIHVEIEAHAGPAIQRCINATDAIDQEDTASVEANLIGVTDAVQKMEATFKRITEQCSTDVYYNTLRPYLFGFDNIVYEGVEEFKGKPQIFRGETGAQSTVIPALQRFLGLQHEAGGLTDHLKIMSDYMPKPHRELLMSIDQNAIRGFVMVQKRSTLTDAYNACLERIVSFRSLHLHMAQAYIASKVKDPRGTGGTEFMHWLKQLRDETAQQFIK